MTSTTTQPESGLSLQGDVVTLLTDPIYHDLTIVCADNSETTACRSFLASRSSVLKRMIYGEGRVPPSKIKLDAVKSSGLCVVLRYIHTETTGDNLLSPSEAVEAYHAATLLHLPKLKKLVLKKADWESRNLTDARALLERAFNLISPNDTSNADLYNILLDPFCKRTLEVGELNGLSDGVLEFLLTWTKSPEAPFNTNEYKLLLCVVDWAWSRGENVPCDVERHARLRRLEFPTEPYGDPSENTRVSLANDITRKSLLKMWHHVKLPLICPHRLKFMMDAVDALTDTSPHYAALSEYACANVQCPTGHPPKVRGRPPPPPVLPMPACVKWRLGADIIVSDNGAVVEFNTESCLMASTAAPLTVPCEWNIVIESIGIHPFSKKPVNDVGLVSQNYNKYNSNWMMEADTSRWIFHTWDSNVAQIFPGTTGGSMDRYGQALNPGDVVTFHLDMDGTSHTCSLLINGRNYGIAWRDLPEKVYPAVCLWPGSRYRYQLKSDDITMIDRRNLFSNNTEFTLCRTHFVANPE